MNPTRLDASEKPLTLAGFLAHWLVFIEGYRFAAPHPAAWDEVAPDEIPPSAEEASHVLATPYLFVLPVALSTPEIVLPQQSDIDGMVLKQDGDTMHLILFREDAPTEPLKSPLRLTKVLDLGRQILATLRREIPDVRRLHCDVLWTVPLQEPPVVADFTVAPTTEPLRITGWQISGDTQTIESAAANTSPRDMELGRRIRHALPRYQANQRSEDFLRHHWWRILFKPHGAALARWVWEMSQSDTSPTTPST